jgi:hypothetical protein
MYLGTDEKSENFEDACERSNVALCAKNEALGAKSEALCATTISSS